MTEQERKVNRPVSFPAAMAKLVGAHLGILALWITYFTGVLNGVRQSTSLFRAVVAGVIFYVSGRILGWYLGRWLEGTLAEAHVAETADAESTSS